VSDSHASSTSSHGRVAIQSVDVSDDARTLIAANNHAEVFAWNPSDATMKQNGEPFRPVAKFRAHPWGRTCSMQKYHLTANISSQQSVTILLAFLIRQHGS